MEEPPTDAAAVAPATLVEAEVALAVEAEAAELNKLNREVFPLPIPTAGTFPVSFPPPEEAPAVAEDAPAISEDAVALA